MSVEPPRILRPGGTEREKIEALIGHLEAGPDGGGAGGETVSVPDSGIRGLSARVSGTGCRRGCPARATNPAAHEDAPCERPNAPGQLKSHYAPRTPLVLHTREEMLALKRDPRAAYLFFDGRARDAWDGNKDGGGNVYALSEDGNRLEAAANLFDLLHTIDKIGAEVVHAQQAPAEGLGLAINDRLARAAAKREV
jgi:L-threonylcarbamoyladenylate synthase